MAWTDEEKAKAIETYTEANPTPETSVEIIKEIAEDMKQSVNGVRMILVKAEVYIKKDPATATASTKTGEKRVSKDDQIKALKDVIGDNGLECNDEVLDKLTGKAAAYFTGLLKAAVVEDE